MSNTKIEWATKVWNPVTGCSKVSAGCKSCYAETYAKRFWGKRKFTDVQCHEDKLDQPFHWKKPQRIFVNSMSDLFHESIPFTFIDSVFEIMGFAKQHIFIILTKRPKRMKEFYNWTHIFNHFGMMDNVWLGASVEDQKTADERIPLLLQTPAAVRFISAEPLLERIEFFGLQPFINDPKFNKLDWVICGGESGKNARPVHPDWARSLRDQCKEANVPFFFKQWVYGYLLINLMPAVKIY